MTAQPILAQTGQSNRTEYDALFAELTDDAEVRALFEKFRAEKTTLCDRFEREAVGHQRVHTRNVIAAGFFGTVAVVCAIVQLSGRFTSILPWCEYSALGIASLAVFMGLRDRRHHSWLLHRHKAERCHLLNWNLLTNLSVWNPLDKEAQKSAIKYAQAQLAVLASDEYQFQQWLDDDLPTLPPLVPSRPPRSLRGIYLDLRLRNQQRYFTTASGRNERLERWSKPVALVTFCGSALVGLGHIGFDIYNRAAHGVQGADLIAGASLALLLASASLPVLAGAIRIIRGAFEPARNTARFKGHARTLQSLITGVEQAKDGELAGELWISELVLESEHRAWLHLMMEAEWFG